MSVPFTLSGSVCLHVHLCVIAFILIHIYVKVVSLGKFYTLVCAWLMSYLDVLLDIRLFYVSVVEILHVSESSEEI